MKFFWFAALFGAAQMVLTAFLSRMASVGKRKFAFLFFLGKAVAYIGGAWLFVFKFLGKYIYLLSGFAVGLAVAALVLMFYSVLFRKSGDD